MSLLSTQGLTKAFGGLTAVSDVDFELPQGEIRALIGPNGAGKTTFVGLLCGRMAPSAGTVRFDGQDISRLAAHERIRLGIAYTFQITSVFARLSAHENVALAVRRRGGDAVREVPEALQRVGLRDRAGDLAGDLSYGHQRLLEIAMGLAQKPRLLILDEPTQGLADSEIDAFCALVRGLAPETTVLLIEHNMSVVMRVAQKITVLNFGAVLAEGAPEVVQADPAVQAAYLGGVEA
ncbi:Branched-chain amino acid transport ATP-binding protein LivG [Candidatus Rhodobacter oscarellae]|uniref:Branched-chain amino acid transport ATP-binding protein LivG n=1 Tax=Candidatus Rhodobacter oscarellae TaxID=1675527 RepID=A0A0J9E8Q9_9RHOB|nr:ABC transporter ATP-binding protein [Candidatus Rhodobacter lobularis]KMW59157.1 Branched-chain amino acid transport ATP-binding protein LivG [Candidatus Rhodobacter lobularis]